MTAAAAMRTGGFADPAAESQAAFRTLLDVLARPGRIAELKSAAVAGLSPAASSVALTLCDFETPVWLGGACAAAADWLRFHCGAPLAVDCGTARFAFAPGIADLPDLDLFDLGSDEFPDRSTTLVLEVASLGRGAALTLSGPGIAGTASLAVAGPSAAFWQARAALGALFPRGLDLFLTSGTQIAALPRATRVEVSPCTSR
ncbi:MAG: phosphonate C-P lyase system protein PhnH [Alphaproteobacteria bacterium]|nr:phosphonate C-P lyase system protein PhnH [Alphaproteobacteria bacterium]